MRYHLDTDFLIKALGAAGPERELLRSLAASSAELEMSAIAWYEFCRGPRKPEAQAAARDLLEPEGVVAFSEDVAAAASEVFRRLGSPRKRAADVAIAVTAIGRQARLLTANTRDYSGIDGLKLGAE